MPRRILDQFTKRARNLLVNRVDGKSAKWADLARTAFDEDFYRQQNADVEFGKLTPLQHFMRKGWREGRDPCGWFSVSLYQQAYADVRNAGMNPLIHYLRHGKAEGRLPAPGQKEALQRKQSLEALERDKKLLRAHFDEAYYLEKNPDIDRKRVDPLDHFALFGWREGRDPNPDFSIAGYLAMHSDVRRQDVNPLLHYVTTGKAEGRETVPAGERKGIIIDPGASVVGVPVIEDLIRFPPRPNRVQKKPYDPESLDIHWLVPDFSAGGGGHMTIFRMVQLLERFGHRCTIWLDRPSAHQDGASAYDDIIRHYSTIRAKVKFRTDGFFKARGDAVFATSWDTVAPVMHATGFREAFYFVQDFEPAFSPRGSLSLAAEISYRQDIACVCASPWLAKLLRKQYGRWTRGFNLAYDPDIYRPEPARREANDPPRIAFYARRHTERRAVDLGMAALQELATRDVAFAVDFFGAPLGLQAAPFLAVDHGVLSPERLAELYRSADIGLCFSTTNYSLIPKEMMGCGLPVLEIDVESTRAIFPDDVVTFAGPDPRDIADKIAMLLKSPAKRRRQCEAALAWCQKFSWHKSARIIEKALRDRLAQRGHKARPRPARAVRVREPVKASVVVPTFNGIDELPKVIEAVRTQQTPWRFEIVCVDSTSSDGTAEWLAAQDDLIVRTIPQSEFRHGGTRNLGASLGTGEFIAFLTQDALPADRNWLYNFVTVLEHFPDAAGGFGRHIAYPQHSPFVKRDIAAHFASFAELPLAVSKLTDPVRWASGDPGWRQKLHFFSDNNSCLRRSVWREIPYPDVVYGEDQLWADAVIKAGYQKVYVPSAAVYHSHSYTPDETRKRCAIEGRFFAENFGYTLMASQRQLAKTLAGLNARDAEWARENSVDEAAVRQQQRLNRAMLEGWLAGRQMARTK